MQIVKLSSRGQLLLPQQLRQRLHLTAGMEFAIALVGNEIHLTPVAALPTTTLEQVAGLLSRPARSEAAVQAGLRERARMQDEASKT